MRSPLRSVIIAASSRLEQLAVALASVRMRLAAGVEVIVLGDGSNARVSAWLAGHGKGWPALRVIETGGRTPPRACNAAIEAARAPVIAFLDPACWWWPNKLAAQIEDHAAPRLAAQLPVACSRAITATYTTQAEAVPSVQHRIAPMGEILSPYQHFPAARTRHAAAKARAKLDCARAGLSRPVTRYACAARGGSRTFMASTQAKAASVHAALNFAGGYGAGK